MSNYFSGFVSGAIVFAIVAFCLGVKYQQSVMISQLRGYCGYRAFYVNHILTIEKIEKGTVSVDKHGANEEGEAVK